MLGRGYVIEHCISTFKALQEEKIYRVYVTDALRALLHGNDIARYYDLISPEEKKQETAEEIKERIMSGLNAIGSE